MMIRLVFFTLLSSLLISCTRNYACHNAYDYVIQFFTYESNNTITDSIATIDEYTKGSNFTSLVNSYPAMPVKSFRNTLMIDHYDHQYILFSKYPRPSGLDHEYMFKYDRIITLYPSGRTYKLRNITHNDRSIRNANNDAIACTNDVTYYANDSLYRIAGGQAPGSYGGDDIYHIKY